MAPTGSVNVLLREGFSSQVDAVIKKRTYFCKSGDDGAQTGWKPGQKNSIEWGNTGARGRGREVGQLRTAQLHGGRMRLSHEGEKGVWRDSTKRGEDSPRPETRYKPKRRNEKNKKDAGEARSKRESVYNESFVAATAKKNN